VVAKKQQVVVRLEKELLKRVDHIAVDWDAFRDEATERLLNIALEKLDGKR